IVCKPQFPSGEGCRRSGGVVCRGGNLPPVIIAAAGVFSVDIFTICGYNNHIIRKGKEYEKGFGSAWTQYQHDWRAGAVDIRQGDL
ncbi:MAG: hypothetical protein FWH14_05510, partial [Oscillospiraceae bacterium]|nr:hypothetical protein [Oscillospiraceae bacterium]